MNAALKQQHISAQVNHWIREEDLPTAATLKPVRRFDGLYPEDEDERTAYFDFIHYAMTKEHAILFSIPTNKPDGFCKLQLDENGDDISAFNTMDYNRVHPFDFHYWKLKQACEQARDWAITYSVVRDPAARRIRLNRFADWVKSEQKSSANLLWKIWNQYAYWE